MYMVMLMLTINTPEFQVSREFLLWLAELSGGPPR